MSDEPTRDELYEKAQDLDIEGRSDMTKDELASAIADAESASSSQTSDYDRDADPLRPPVSSTGPKTAAAPAAGVPVAPVNVQGAGRFGLVPNTSSSRLGANKIQAKERRAAAREAA